MFFATKALATVAAAMAVVTASDYFPFEYPSECVTSCSLKAGKKCWSSYTQDENSPDFVQSLSCLCDSSNPGNGAFMANSLACLTESKCEGKDIMTSMQLQGPICEWYNQHKNDSKPTTTEKPETTEPQKPIETSETTTTSESTETTTIPEPTEAPKPIETPDITTTTTTESTAITESTETTETPKPTETLETTTTTTESTKTSESTTTEATTSTESTEATTSTVTEGSSSTSTILPTCEPITVTTTVFVTDNTPKPTATSCQHGVYKCIDSGKSGDFTVCVHGKEVANTCSPGTVCKSYEGSIVCDWA